MDEYAMTEEEFLAAYDADRWPKPSLTADICVFRRRLEGGIPEGGSQESTQDGQGWQVGQSRQSLQDGQVGHGWQLLLVERGGHPFRGCWALPGGFSEPGEDIDQTAARELAEETGLSNMPLERTYVYSGPGRDPRCWVATQAFMCVVPAECEAQAGDDAAKAMFFDVDIRRIGEGLELVLVHDDVRIEVSCALAPQPYSGVNRAVDARGTGLAFDHARIISDAVLYLQDAVLGNAVLGNGVQAAD